MSLTLTASRTSIELRSNQSISADNTDWQASTRPADPDNIVEASRIADAAVPDGGYGWVIVAACSVITFWFVGTTYSWGVIQDALVVNKVAEASTLAFVGSVAVACNAAFAILSSRLVRLLGARKLAVIGILLMSMGQILSGFTQKSIGGLFVTAGFLMGCGLSSCFMVVSVVTAQYFNKRRGLANGIVYAGGGLGGAVISLSMSGIVTHFGTAWTFRFLGLAMLATGLPAAWLIKERAPIRTAMFVDLHLFKDIIFVAFFLTGVIGTFPLFVAPFFLPLYARSLGYTPRVGATLVAAFNFSSAIGRILTGFLGDRLGPVNALLISLVASAISLLTLWPISTTLAPLIVFCIINGMSNGGFFAIMPTVVSNVFGSARVTVAMGMIVSGWTGGYLMGAPIAGYILAAYGGQAAGFKAYRPAIFYAGSLALVATGLCAFARFRMSKSPLHRL